MRNQFRALLKAILADNPIKVRLLLKADARLATCVVPEGQYEAGLAHWIYANDTALHIAAAGYRVEIAKMLLNANAAVDACGNHLQSRPLHYAADARIDHPFWNAARQVATLRLLLAAGATIDSQDKNGATALHHAVRNHGVAAVKCLLAAGADATARNKSGSTPFHLAVRRLDRRETGMASIKAARREIIEAFFSHGLSASLPDAKGKTVMDTAKSAWIRKILINGGKLL